MMYIMRNIINKTVLVFTERGIEEFTLRTRHVVLTGINMLRTCKGIAGLTVSAGAEIKETAKALRTDLIRYSVELKSWYGGTTVTFTTSGGEAWKTL